MKKKNIAITIEEAKEIIFKSINNLDEEKVSILNAPGRVLFQDVVSDILNPPLNNSAMDGYAIIAEDTIGASRENPVKLKIIGEIQAGGDFTRYCTSKNTAIRIMTGAPIPEGANAVIQFEDTNEEDNIVSIYKEINKYDNYRFAGEDIKKGDIVLNKGHRLKSSDIGLLASLNYAEINVFKQPTVAIISTGDEIVDIGGDLKLGSIRNSNPYTLFSEAKKYSALPRIMGIAKDTIDDTKNKFIKAMESDIVITTGGVSMGKYDFVKDVYNDLGIEILFEWIKMKPGRPCTFGRKEKTLFFGLPGNPVSSLISFILLVRPAILKMMAADKIDKPIVNAVLKEDIKKKPDRTNFIRGHYTIKDNNFFVTTTGPQGSGILRSMSNANCFIILPIGVKEVYAGETVMIHLNEHDEI